MKPTLDRTNLLAQVCGAVCLGLSAILVLSPYQLQANDPAPAMESSCPALSELDGAGNTQSLGRTAGL